MVTHRRSGWCAARDGISLAHTSPIEIDCQPLPILLRVYAEALQYDHVHARSHRREYQAMTA